jgi:Skp family chaperone for outer membrane proteins
MWKKPVGLGAKRTRTGEDMSDKLASKKPTFAGRKLAPTRTLASGFAGRHALTSMSFFTFSAPARRLARCLNALLTLPFGLAATLAADPAPGVASANESAATPISFVDTRRLRSTQGGIQEILTRDTTLRAEFAETQKALHSLDARIAELQVVISRRATAGEATTEQQAELTRLLADGERLLAETQTRFRARADEIHEPIIARMTAALADYGTERGFTALLDAHALDKELLIFRLASAADADFAAYYNTLHPTPGATPATSPAPAPPDLPRPTKFVFIHKESLSKSLPDLIAQDAALQAEFSPQRAALSELGEKLASLRAEIAELAATGQPHTTQDEAQRVLAAEAETIREAAATAYDQRSAETLGLINARLESQMRAYAKARDLDAILDSSALDEALMTLAPTADATDEFVAYYQALLTEPPSPLPSLAPAPSLRVAFISGLALSTPETGPRLLTTAAAAVRAKMQTEMDQLTAEGARIRELETAISRLSAAGTAVAEPQAELTRRQADFATANQTMEANLQRIAAELFAPSLAQVKEALITYGEAHGYDVLLDRDKVAPALLSIAPAADLTADFVVFANTRLTAPAVPATP